MIQIVKWNEYQDDQFKTPRWVRLHSSTLTSRTWVKGSDTDRTLMMALILLAAQNDNQIPNDLEFIKDAAKLSVLPQLDYLVSVGFITVTDDEFELSSDKPKAKARGLYFEQFWRVYPKKRDKKRAKKIWEREKLDNSAGVILRDVEKRAQHDGQWLKDEGQYIPNPSTYLNNERWNDEITELVGKPSDISGRNW